ncbi:MAG: DUF2851 family protein [Prevotellaceae bacterium]|jgi:hypothetical protein|nr:DUF2851 family protein [Prevotellaceae bacterium]
MEQLLQFIWKHGLFSKESARTTAGERIEVLATGVQNIHAGADFSNAKITIGNTLWAGCVEVHTNASDWHKHHHSQNKAYNNVILHVVKNNDCPPIKNEFGAIIPVYEMQYDTTLERHYGQLLKSAEFAPCRPLVKSMEVFKIRHFLTRLAVERLEQRTARVNDILSNVQNSWEDVLLRLLFRSFGFGLNGQPFELLAQSLSAAQIAKHRNSLPQVEALLFGQAGFLQEPKPADAYHLHLQQEYALLQAKFSLTPIPQHTWKFLRTRPVNFPTIRIAQLAMLLHKNPNLFTQVLEVVSLDSCIKIFDVKTSEYWETRYAFGKESERKAKPLGKKSIERIAANLVAPIIFAYGMQQEKEDICNRAIDLLEQLPGESNVIISGWKSLNITPQNMFESQALIQLKQEYCDKKRCLQCSIGAQIFKN